VSGGGLAQLQSSSASLRPPRRAGSPLFPGGVQAAWVPPVATPACPGHPACFMLSPCTQSPLSVGLGAALKFGPCLGVAVTVAMSGPQNQGLFALFLQLSWLLLHCRVCVLVLVAPAGALEGGQGYLPPHDPDQKSATCTLDHLSLPHGQHPFGWTILS